MFDEYTLFFVPQKVGISYKVKKAAPHTGAATLFLNSLSFFIMSRQPHSHPFSAYVPHAGNVSCRCGIFLLHSVYPCGYP